MLLTAMYYFGVPNRNLFLNVGKSYGFTEVFAWPLFSAGAVFGPTALFTRATQVELAPVLLARDLQVVDLGQRWVRPRKGADAG